MLIAKRSARSTRIRTIVQLRHLVFTAPDELRSKLGGLSATELVNQAARLRPRAGGDVVVQGIKTAAAILARRVQALDAELGAIDIQLDPLVKDAAPGLLNIFGVGVDTAAVLIVAAGDNPERVSSESAWAVICGVAPIPVMSGKSSNRYRFNPGGNRQANNALWRIVIPASASTNHALWPTCIAASKRANRSQRSSAVSSDTSPEKPSKRSCAEPDRSGGTGPITA